jgi:hypothetical protein
MLHYAVKMFVLNHIHTLRQFDLLQLQALAALFSLPLSLSNPIFIHSGELILENNKKYILWLFQLAIISKQLFENFQKSFFNEAVKCPSRILLHSRFSFQNYNFAKWLNTERVIIGMRDIQSIIYFMFYICFFNYILLI